jgi:hypothetical protein
MTDQLKDGTAASQAGGFGADSADFARGFKDVGAKKTDKYSEDAGAEAVGDPMTNNPGGVLGRPQGWAR